MRRRGREWAWVAPLVSALVALLVTGCDVDIAQDADRPAAADTVRAGLVALYAGPEAGAAEEAEAACFADRLLDDVALEELVESEVVGDDGAVAVALPILDLDLAEAWAGAHLACADPARVRCLAERMGSAEAIRSAEVRALSGGVNSTEVGALLRAQEACA